MPRAYKAMIRSLNPSRRVCPLRTIFGSKVPLRSPGHRQVDRADIGQHRLSRGSVAVVAAAPPGRIMLVITEVTGHLLGQRPLQHRLGHLRQQPIGTQQLDPFGLGLAQQLIGQLFIDQRPPARRAAIGFAGHHRSV
jgi:hypothetical protein